MEWSAIGAWAGEHGPYLAIITLLCSLVWKFANRLLDQQEIVLKALIVTEKAVEAKEKDSAT